MEDRQWFVLYVLICLEVGLFLMLVPWSTIWERNYFLEAYPELRPWLLSPAFRGAVCGLGLANLYLGVTEILNRFRSGSEAREPEETDDAMAYERHDRDAASSSERDSHSPAEPLTAREERS